MITLADGRVFNNVAADNECRKANAVWTRKNNFGTINWDTVYDSEQDMINDLAKIYIPKGRQSFTNLFRGYEYIYSFAYYVQKGWTLSDKQIQQCKKLAAEIRKAAIVSSYVN